MYICPKCSENLIKINNTMKCRNNHSYDVSADGYVNLLMNNKKSGVHGDNKKMISARRKFLALDHYSIIVDKLCELIEVFCKQNFINSPVILDTGCGEGYYSNNIFSKLSLHLNNVVIFATDVSKDAVKFAAKSYKNINFSVSSINKLPFSADSFNIVLSLFAPLSESEFNRILKCGGILITVSPSENHLFALKSVIYDTPYKNNSSNFKPKIMEKCYEETITSDMHLNNNQEISDLFAMTPYYYNTSDSDKEKLKTISELDTEIGFVFNVFYKPNNT